MKLNRLFATEDKKVKDEAKKYTDQEIGKINGVKGQLDNIKSMMNTHDTAFGKVKAIVDKIEKNYVDKSYVDNKLKNALTNVDTTGVTSSISS